MDVKMNLSAINRKNKRSSGRMESNCLIRNYNRCNDKRYLNISVDYNGSRAGVAEWLTQLLDTQCLKWFAGSIPVSSVICFSKREVSII